MFAICALIKHLDLNTDPREYLNKVLFSVTYSPLKKLVLWKHMLISVMLIFVK